MKPYGLLALFTLVGYLCFWQLATQLQVNGAGAPPGQPTATRLHWLQPRPPVAGATQKPATQDTASQTAAPAALSGAVAPLEAPHAALQESLGLFLADLDLTPYYPAAARQRGIQGRVMLEITLGKGYAVQGVRLAQQGPHPLLEQAAQRLVLEQGFKISAFLASRHGTSFHGASLLVPVRFALL